LRLVHVESWGGKEQRSLFFCREAREGDQQSPSKRWGFCLHSLLPFAQIRMALLLLVRVQTTHPVTPSNTLFKVDDEVFIRNRPQEYSYRVSQVLAPSDLAGYFKSKGLTLHEACASAISAGLPIAPHYEVASPTMDTRWIVSQLQLSPSPIRDRKR
jgi:hypothetical protein